MEALETPVEIPAQPRRRWGLVVVCGAGAHACLAGLRAVSHREGLEPAFRLAALASLSAALLLLAAVTWASLGRRPLLERLGLQPGLAGAGTVLLLAVGLLGLSQALDQIIELLGLRATSQLAQYDAAVAGAPELAWPFLLLGLAVAPGIGEEIFFRGLVQRGLTRWLGRAGAVLAASAAFGALHGDPVHAAGAFGLGLYLGAVAELTGGTRAPIACHVLNNLAAVGSVALPQPLPLPSGTLVAVGLAVAGFSLLTASRLLRRRH
jgi:membrane protease YdiL (CAAX protease family)